MEKHIIVEQVERFKTLKLIKYKKAGESHISVIFYYNVIFQPLCILCVHKLP